MNKQESASSPLDLQSDGKAGSIVTVAAGTPISRSPEEVERLRWLASRPDSEIDFSDIPRLTPEEYDEAKRFVAAQRSAKLKRAS